LGRRKTVYSRLVRRRPSRYTASYSARRTSRQARGKPSRGASDARETVASLLAALREYFASTLTLHACTEAVLLVAGAHVRLICAFRHRSLSSAGWPLSAADCAHRRRFAASSELPSVCDRRSTVKERPPLVRDGDSVLTLPAHAH
jgi:hypothetical protein